MFLQCLDTCVSRSGSNAVSLLSFSQRWGVSDRAQRCDPVCSGLAHAHLSRTARRATVWKRLIHFSITLWHLCLYSEENAPFDSAAI